MIAVMLISLSVYLKFSFHSRNKMMKMREKYYFSENEEKSRRERRTEQSD
jgi:hypothetical protein